MIGFASERVTSPPRTVYRRGDGCTVVVTPERPDYHFGNLLELDEPCTGADLPRYLAIWKAEFGDLAGLKRRVLRWETLFQREPDAEQTLEAAAAAEGLECEQDTVLVLNEPRVRTPKAPLDCRPAQQYEWSALLELLSGDSPEQREFWRWRMVIYRRLINRRAGQWWLGWSDGEPVTTAGIFWCTVDAAPLGSFERVFTRKDRRGLGFCSTLIGRIATVHRARRPHDTVVIIAETGSQAERIYQQAGFRPVSYINTLIGSMPSGD